jgi:hypothetical protein
MIMDSMGRGKFFGSGKNNLVVGEDRLEVRDAQKVSQQHEWSGVGK